MHIPIFISAKPATATRSAIVRIPEGEWVIESDATETIVGIAISDSPLTLMEMLDKKMIPLGEAIHVTGIKYVLAIVTHKGSEPHFNVHAKKKKAA